MEPRGHANHLCEVHLHRPWLFNTFALVATPYDLLLRRLVRRLAYKTPAVNGGRVFPFLVNFDFAPFLPWPTLYFLGWAGNTRPSPPPPATTSPAVATLAVATLAIATTALDGSSQGCPTTSPATTPCTSSSPSGVEPLLCDVNARLIPPLISAARRRYRAP